MGIDNPYYNMMEYNIPGMGLGLLGTLWDMNVRWPQYREDYEWARSQNIAGFQKGNRIVDQMQGEIEAGYENLGIRTDADWQALIGRQSALGAGVKQDASQAYTGIGQWFGGEVGHLGEEMAAGWEGFTSGVTGRAEARAAELQQRYGHRTEELMGMWRPGAAAISGDYGALRDEAMGMVGTLGEQTRADISERYEQLGAEQQAGLAARGLGSTTLLADAMRETTGLESAEQRRLDEQLTRERLGVLSEFGQAELLARERMLGAEVGLYAGATGDALGAAERGGYFLSDLESQLGMGQLTSQEALGRFGVEGGLSIQQAEAAMMAALGQWQTGMMTGIGAQQIGSNVALGLGGIQGGIMGRQAELDWLNQADWGYPTF